MYYQNWNPLLRGCILHVCTYFDHIFKKAFLSYSQLGSVWSNVAPSSTDEKLRPPLTFKLPITGPSSSTPAMICEHVFRNKYIWESVLDYFYVSERVESELWWESLTTSAPITALSLSLWLVCTRGGYDTNRKQYSRTPKAVTTVQRAPPLGDRPLWQAACW